MKAHYIKYARIRVSENPNSHVICAVFWIFLVVPSIPNIISGGSKSPLGATVQNQSIIWIYTRFPSRTAPSTHGGSSF